MNYWVCEDAAKIVCVKNLENFKNQAEFAVSSF
jgi:hypothetical protein